MGTIHDRLATVLAELKSKDELQMIRVRQRIAEATAALPSPPPLYWPQWAFDILALAASMHGDTWRATWQECRKLLPKSRRRDLSHHHIPKQAAFKCWLAGEVIVPDRWRLRP